MLTFNENNMSIQTNRSGGYYDQRTENIIILTGNELQSSPWQQKLDSICSSLSGRLDRYQLKPLVQLLVAALKPEKIYMAEHQPSGEGTTHIIDLLIVLTSDKPIPELEPLMQIGGLKDERVRCTLYNEQRLLHALEHEHVFYTLHCVPENLVYDNGRKAYPVLSLEQTAALKAGIVRDFSRHLGAVDRFLACAEDTRREEQQSGLAGFFVHQSVETVYRSLIRVLDGYDKRCHQIRALQKAVRLCAPQLQSVFPDNTKQEQRLLDLLEDCYLRGRYDDGFTIADNDLDVLIARGHTLRNTAERMVTSIMSG